jgi:hypothetical protein
MHYIKLSSKTSSMKLFPRLAMPSGPHKPKRPSRPRRLRTLSAGIIDDSETARRQVRDRLLRMILENERVRRHEQRPSAS